MNSWPAICASVKPPGLAGAGTTGELDDVLGRPLGRGVAGRSLDAGRRVGTAPGFVEGWFWQAVAAQQTTATASVRLLVRVSTGSPLGHHWVTTGSPRGHRGKVDVSRW